MSFWKDKAVLVTGGASFIGSHLVDALVAKGARVHVVDNLSSGKLPNIQGYIDQRSVQFIHGDLLDPVVVSKSVRNIEIVFHLAANHGGRGYVDLRQVECSTNLILDGLLFREALRAGVQKIVYASSGCVYPNHIQTNPKEEKYLTEELVGPPYDADNLYGWAKLLGELTLRSYYQQHSLKSVSCRYFTVYGPRGKENHAVLAMIARAFIGADPFEVWGTGEQIRNWTYVSDIVSGTLLAGEKIDDASAVNLGTMERIRVVDAVKMILEFTGHKASLQFRPEMPTGPLNRVADNGRAKMLLGWKPQVVFREGVKKTIDWYYKERNKDVVQSELADILIERQQSKDSNLTATAKIQ